jgi:hypothetical protein
LVIVTGSYAAAVTACVESHHAAKCSSDEPDTMASNREDRDVRANSRADEQHDQARLVQLFVNGDRQITDLQQRVERDADLKRMLITYAAQLEDEVRFLRGVVLPVQLRGLSDILVSRYGRHQTDEDRRPSVRIASTELASVLAIASQDVERVLTYDQLSLLAASDTNHRSVKASMSETKERIALCPGHSPAP